VSGIYNTAIVKLDSLGNQMFAKYYTSQFVYYQGFTVDNSETYMYMVDSHSTSDFQITKANAVDGTINSVFET
jgi:hypothetical protein